MKILVLNPYFTGSHKTWAENYAHYSEHEVQILSLPGKHWKWRMHGAAITLARKVDEWSADFDMILATDMMDVAVFRGLCMAANDVPIALYMHENQLSYPFSQRDTDKISKRDNHYGFINYTSCLAADQVFFNSSYHMKSFLEELGKMLTMFPDNRELWALKTIAEKSEVLELGVDLKRIDIQLNKQPQVNTGAVVIWNHRWEHDKNPEEFFSVLMELQSEGVDFRVVVVGESFAGTPEIFETAAQRLADRIIHWGYCKSRKDYLRYLCMSDILPVTSNHDFFGVSVVEAIYCGVKPLLPNRLAYPEHLDKIDLSECLYADGEFKNRLRSMLLNWNPRSNRFKNERVNQYDWSIKAPEYDKRFTDLVQC